jgi:hypothetical protein
MSEMKHLGVKKPRNQKVETMSFVSMFTDHPWKMIFVSMSLLQLLVCLYDGNSSSTASLYSRFVQKRIVQKEKKNQSTLLLQSENIEDSSTKIISDMTLRKFVSHADGFHLAMAPSFFGYYAYFGALMALEEGVFSDSVSSGYTVLPRSSGDVQSRTQTSLLKSVAGASSGAMAAVLAASGIKPRTAAEFASTLNFSSFADPPGIGAFLKGNLFESLLVEFLSQQLHISKDNTQQTTDLLRLEKARIPVAVTGFDITTMSARILTKGSIARAARASATFPGLFQPVIWNEDETNTNAEKKSIWNYFSNPSPILIDGGVTDTSGYLGLSAILPSNTNNKRILNLVVGDFHLGKIPAPSIMRSKGVQASEVVSISIQNSPKCGPWAMENGPIAVEAVRQAVIAALDTPMKMGNEDGHYILNIDTTDFIAPTKK